MAKAVSEVVFFVTDGPAYCLDCAAGLPDEEREHLRPVRADGAGDDGCGLICECGLRWPPGEEVE